MKLCELLLYYEQKRQALSPKDKKKSENDFIVNVHKGYQFYQHVDADINVEVETILENLDDLFSKFNEKLKPTSTRNYMRWIQMSLSEEPLSGVLTPDIVERARTKINDALQETYKEASRHIQQNARKHETNQAIINIDDAVSSLDEEDNDNVIDIEQIVPTKASEQQGEPRTMQQLVDENIRLHTKIQQLIEENKYLEAEREKDAIRFELTEKMCERLWRIIESKH